MSKLYPPNIEGTLPAFYNKMLVIPYTMNKAVAYSEISGFQLKVSTVYNSMTIFTLFSNNFDETQVYFDISNKTALNIGQSYKVQLAYYSTDEIIGYYSTVGIIKFTAKPSVEIEGLRLNDPSGLVNINSNIFKAKYLNEDITEKPYLYKFDLYDREKNLLETSGELFSNSYELTYSLEDYYQYYIKLTITTANGVVAESGYYRIMESLPVDLDKQITLTAENNPDKGSVDLKFKGSKGYFKILRAEGRISGVEHRKYRTHTPTVAEKNKETVILSSQWQDMHHFSIIEGDGSYTWEDTTVEPGKTYCYCVRQYGLSRVGKSSDIVYAKSVQLEHNYLSDAEQQFVIKYNPKVNSFKNTLLETKTNTIGGKHPFIFRNGKVKYKEFSFSGRIALAESNDLTQDNFNKERELKLNVLDWLNNGKPKLFRSLAEGCYIIRLLNVSLSSEEKIGRLIATFSATAYEIADCDYVNLKRNGIINLDTSIQESEESITYLPSVEDGGIGNILQSNECRNVKLTNFPIGTRVKINNSEEIEIDSSGKLELMGVISSLELLSYTGASGIITYNCIKRLTSGELDIPFSNKAIQDVPFAQVNEDFNLEQKVLYYYRILDSDTNEEKGYYNLITKEKFGEELDLTKLDIRTIYVSYYEEVDI